MTCPTDRLIWSFFSGRWGLLYPEIYLLVPLPDFAIPAILPCMITRHRIRELLLEHDLTPDQLDAIAAYCDSVQTELTEAQVHKIAKAMKKER